MTGAADAMRQRFEVANTALVERNEEIRKRVAAGESKEAVARQYGISRVRVQQIVSGSRGRTRREAAAYRALVAEGKALPLDGEGAANG